MPLRSWSVVLLLATLGGLPACFAPSVGVKVLTANGQSFELHGVANTLADQWDDEAPLKSASKAERCAYWARKAEHASNSTDDAFEEEFGSRSWRNLVGGWVPTWGTLRMWVAARAKYECTPEDIVTLRDNCLAGHARACFECGHQEACLYISRWDSPALETMSCAGGYQPACDARAEFEVFQRFKELSVARTSVLISHRFSSVRMADRILVLANGAVEAAGTHAQLLAQGGRYAELFELQAAGYR